MAQRSTFHYRRSLRLLDWGCSFDSLTEVKFALSIMDEYFFLRNQVSIYFHPGTLQPTASIRTCHRRYTPDFLIRHRETGEAFLVEIKPRAFERDPQLSYRKTIAENYIRRKGYDWTFKVVFDDEIILSEDRLREFEDCCRFKSKSDHCLWLREYGDRFDRSAPCLFQQDLTNTFIETVFWGKADKK